MAKGRLAAKLQAYELVLFSIHDDRGWHFDVGLLECGHFFFPVFRVELNKDRP